MRTTVHEPGGITAHLATADRWDDAVEVFESGAIGNRCWCQWIRKTQQQARDDGAEGNRESLRVLIADSKAPGLIAYLQKEPVGWCSFGPKSSFGRLSRSKSLTPSPEHPSPDQTWATLCFFLSPQHRGKGVARALLRAAVTHARKLGATAYEGYPVRTKPGGVNNDSAYPGTEGMFATEGFFEVESTASGRSSQIIMRRML